jgi:hypothetical protein
MWEQAYLQASWPVGLIEIEDVGMEVIACGSWKERWDRFLLDFYHDLSATTKR